MTSTAVPAAPTAQVAQVRYEQAWAPGRIPLHEFTARTSTGVILGRLVVNGETPDEAGGQVLNPWTIRTVSVRHDHQRRGIATLLLDTARRVLPAVHHSPYPTPDGAAWQAACLTRDPAPATDQPTTTVPDGKERSA